MYWFKWHCHTNDAGALYRVIITVRRVILLSLAYDSVRQVHLCLFLWRLLPAFSLFAAQRFNNLSPMSVTCPLLCFHVSKMTYTVSSGTLNSSIPLPSGTVTSPQPSVKLLICVYNWCLSRVIIAILIWDFCLSVHYVMVFCLNKSTQHQTHQSCSTTWKKHHSIFGIPSAFQNSEADTLNGGVKIGVGPQFLLITITLSITNNKSQVPLPWSNRITFDDLDDFERQTRGASYFNGSRMHHLNNSKQIWHGRPSTEQPYFRVNISLQLNGVGTHSPEIFGQPTYAYRAWHSNQILLGTKLCEVTYYKIEHACWECQTKIFWADCICSPFDQDECWHTICL